MILTWIKIKFRIIWYYYVHIDIAYIRHTYKRYIHCAYLLYTSSLTNYLLRITFSSYLLVLGSFVRFFL